MRRIFAIVLIVLGLSTIGAAIASGTLWRPDDRVTLTLPATPDVPLVTTAPGVLNAVDNHVDVRIVGASADSPIVLAMARESDALAWIGDAPHWEITGLADWETLAYTDSAGAVETDPGTSDGATDATDAATETAEPSDTAEPTETATGEAEPTATVPNPSGSDLWVEELTGTGELEYSWTAVPGRWVMLVATDGTQPAPQVELTWDREVETPFVQPGIILGSVVLLLGIGLLIMQLLADAEKRRARRTATAGAVAAPAAAAVVTTDGDRPLTRREIRLADEARRRGARPERDSAPVERESAVDGATETIPVVPATSASVAPTESAPIAGEPAPGAAEPGDEAGELDAWVRSGSASPLLHEGDRTTPSDLEVDEAEPTGVSGEPEAGQATDASGSDEDGPRESWWRRRSGRKAEDPVVPATSIEGEADQAAGVVENDVAPAPAAERGGQVTGETDEIPAVDPDAEGDPQEWGASWRQTWGVGSDDAGKPGPETDPKEGGR